MLTLEREVTDDTVCKKGVNIPFLVKIAANVDPEWATSDVCTKVVKPATKFKKVAYYQLEENEADEKGNTMIGEADYFCSHAWKYKFVNVVNALELFCKKNGLIPEQTYFWFDLFINNQHQAPNFSYKWWCTRFKQAIKRFGKVVLVLEPWSDPIPIKRAWCLWEIFCTIDTESEFYVAMCQEEHKDFKLRLVTNFEEIRTSLSKIDARRADATNADDRDNIFTAIEKGVGFTKLNERVIGKMREWLLNAGETLLMETSQDFGEKDLRTFQTYNCLGKLYRDMNRYSKAEQIFSTALSGLISITSEDDPYTTEVKNNYAFSLQKQGKYEEAIEMHQSCLESRIKKHGKFHKDTTQSMSNLATALRMIGSLEKAKKMFKDAVKYRDQIEKMGPDHPATLYTVSQYAMTLSLNGDFEEAEKQHQRAVKGLTRFFNKITPDGRKHPLTLLALHNMGHHLMLVEQYVEAKNTLCDAYHGRVEKLGQEAKPTKETKNLLDMVLSALKDKNIDTRISCVTPKIIEDYLKDKKKRRRLWEKANYYLSLRAVLNCSVNGDSEKDFSLDSNFEG